MAVPRSGVLGPGERLGRYRVVRRLGTGSMGTVHEAVDEVLGRPVALKVIAPAVAGDPRARERFAAEARAQAAVDSPHVVAVHALEELDGVPVLVSQLIPDGDLGRLVRAHGPLRPALAVDLVTQVATGLAEAHRVGLLHRDVKPANVLLHHRGDRWSAYLADFGVAGAVGSVCDGAGTPAYLAPEVAAGAPSSAASDIYALGCLLGCVLTGRPPGGRVPRAALPGRWGRDLAPLLRGMLAPEPADRFTDLGPVLALLDRCQVTGR